jgi:hypothetical protein
METKTTNCVICASPLVEKLNAKKNWQTPRLLRWAELRDLNIDEKILAEHLKSHLNDNGAKPARNQIGKNRPETITLEPAADKSAENTNIFSSDEQLLNLIVQQIYLDLKDNKLDLKIEHAFKAIELKQKLVESGNVENLLLELLNEIRSQELTK